MSNQRVNKNPKPVNTQICAKIATKPLVKKNSFRIFLSKQQATLKAPPKNYAPKKTLVFLDTEQPLINRSDVKMADVKEYHPPFEARLEHLPKATISIEGPLIEKAALSSKHIDEINALVKKLTMSFSAKKTESCFYIKEGVFKNARFDLHCHDKNLDLVMSYAEKEAIYLVNQHRGYLTRKLASKEIKLRSLMFGS